MSGRKVKLKWEIHLDDVMLATCSGVRLNVSNVCLAANSDDWNLLVAAAHSPLPIQCLEPLEINQMFIRNLFNYNLSHPLDNTTTTVDCFNAISLHYGPVAADCMN